MTNREIPLEREMGRARQISASSLVYVLCLAIFFATALFIIYIATMLGTRQYSQLLRWVPLTGVAFVLSLVGILAITSQKAGWRVFYSTAFLLPLLISVLGITVNRSVWSHMDARDEDIYYTFEEGQRLLNGQNLYERILGSDMRQNDKYATYLPLFYQLAHWTQAIGLEHFARWLLFWREIFLIFNLAVGALLFYVPYKSGNLILAVFASLFWLFNRWTLSATISADFDFIPMFFLILGLVLFPRRLWLSGLLIGLALSLKHFGLFLVPLLLIITWRTSNLKQTLIYLVSIVAIPLLVSTPFLLANWRALILSILFSATRYPFSSLSVDSVDALLGWVGLPAKIPMLGLLALVYALALRFKRRVYVLSLLVMSVFVYFNSVFFPDYVMYMVPFIPLAANEALVLEEAG
jgi:hypothetical protein